MPTRSGSVSTIHVALACAMMSALLAVGAIPAATAAPPVDRLARVEMANSRPFDAAPEAVPVRRWPGNRITYFDATLDPVAVSNAVQLWNRTGLNIRFVKVRDQRRAQVVISNSRRVPAGCGSGLATLGYNPYYPAWVHILHGRTSDGQLCAWPGQTLVVEHELGHVLGLQHNDSRCSLMNTSHTNGVAPTQCVDRSDYDQLMPGRWWCRGPELADLKILQRMYGGRLNPVPKDPWCDLAPSIPVAGPMTGIVSSFGQVDLSVVRAAEPALEPWLLVNSSNAGYELHYTPGGCTAVPGDFSTVVERGGWEVPVGGTQSLSAVAYLRYGEVGCFTLWSVDVLDQYSDAPATLLLTGPVAAG